MEDDKRDLERILEEHGRLIFAAKTEQERKKAERELVEHLARPKLTDDIEQLARDFEIRLKRAALLPSDTPAAYKEAFMPFLEKVAAIPPLDKWEVLGWDLYTQHVVKFSFDYGVEPLLALLVLKVFGLIYLAPEVFTTETDDSDEVERARKTREFVEGIEAAVNEIAQRAFGYFLEALRGRLGAVLDQTLDEIVVRAIDEMESELNNASEKHSTRLRKYVLDEWTKVEKVRLGTPGQGPATLTKEAFEALIDEAQAKLRPLKMDQTKTSVVEYINRNHPAVRCSSVKQLNRQLTKYELENKFKGGEEGTNL